MTLPKFEIIIDNIDWADGNFVNVSIIDLEINIDEKLSFSFNYATDLEIPQIHKEQFSKLIEDAIATIIMQRMKEQNV